MPDIEQPLNMTEEALVEATRWGDEVDFRGRPGCHVIRASLLRHLLLGHCITPPMQRSVQHPGVRVYGARIEGNLDLRDFALPGSGLPAVALEQCEINGDVHLKGARLSRLSVANSRIRLLDMRELVIEGEFEFSGVSGYGDNSAWIDARGCRIGGQVAGRGAKLRMPIDPRREIRPGDKRYALWMVNADIRGSVLLTSGFEAVGGASFSSARVGGDIWADRARFVQGEGFAFNAQSARIGGHLSLWRAEVTGKVWLPGSRTGASLLLQGAQLTGTDDGGRPDVKENLHALVAENAHIGGDVFMNDGFRAKGLVSMTSIRIRANLQIDKAEFSQPSVDTGIVLSMSNAEVGDDATFDNTVAKGCIDLRNATFGGNLSFAAARLESAPPASNPQKACCLDLTATKIAGDLQFAGTRLLDVSSPAARAPKPGVAIAAYRIDVGGNLSFTEGFEAAGAVMLTGGAVGSDLRVQDASFINPGWTALHCKDLHVGDDLQFERCTVQGDLRLDRADVKSRLEWKELAIGCRRNGAIAAPLDLREARIGTSLKATSLEAKDGSEINLTGARIGTIDHVWPAGWGTKCCALRLDGLVYDRVVVSDTPLTYIDTLHAWLERQLAHEQSRFLPQPYRQLARVLREQGEEEMARRIAISEQWAVPKRTATGKVTRWLFGSLFGFGLRPRLASVVLLAYLAIGAAGVWAADQNDVLVETAMPAATAVAIEKKPAGSKNEGLVHVFAPAGNDSPVHEILCHDTVHHAADYAIFAADMLVPFLPLHAEGKCEISAAARGEEWWRAARAFYIAIGWGISSLVLVTWSGMLRRFDREA